MRSRLFVYVFLSLCISAAYGQVPRGTVREGLVIESAVLGKPVRYTVYLPFDYDTSSRYYPVVYLLHGYSDNDMGWIQFGEAHLIADEAIARRDIPPMILVMPDGGAGWYVNNFDRTVPYEDFFFKEFMGHIERTYRIRSEKRYRAVAGLSMGGFGALVYGMRHPELFGSVVAFSAAVRSEDDYVSMDAERWGRVEGLVYGTSLAGRQRITPHLLEYNPLHMARNTDVDKLEQLRYYIDCGDDDFLSKGNALLHIALRERGIPHEYRVRDGDHRWSYWRTGLPEGLKFIGTLFHQP